MKIMSCKCRKTILTFNNLEDFEIAKQYLNYKCELCDKIIEEIDAQIDDKGVLIEDYKPLTKTTRKKVLTFDYAFDKGWINRRGLPKTNYGKAPLNNIYVAIKIAFDNEDKDLLEDIITLYGNRIDLNKLSKKINSYLIENNILQQGE